MACADLPDLPHYVLHTNTIKRVAGENQQYISAATGAATNSPLE